MKDPDSTRIIDVPVSSELRKAQADLGSQGPQLPRTPAHQMVALLRSTLAI